MAGVAWGEEESGGKQGKRRETRVATREEEDERGGESAARGEREGAQAGGRRLAGELKAPGGRQGGRRPAHSEKGKAPRRGPSAAHRVVLRENGIQSDVMDDRGARQGEGAGRAGRTDALERGQLAPLNADLLRLHAPSAPPRTATGPRTILCRLDS